MCRSACAGYRIQDTYGYWTLHLCLSLHRSWASSDTLSGTHCGTSLKITNIAIHMLNKDTSKITCHYNHVKKSRRPRYKICSNVHSPVFIMLNPDKRTNKIIIYYSSWVLRTQLDIFARQTFKNKCLPKRIKAKTWESGQPAQTKTQVQKVQGLCSWSKGKSVYGDKWRHQGKTSCLRCHDAPPRPCRDCFMTGPLVYGTMGKHPGILAAAW